MKLKCTIAVICLMLSSSLFADTDVKAAPVHSSGSEEFYFNENIDWSFSLLKAHHYGVAITVLENLLEVVNSPLLPPDYDDAAMIAKTKYLLTVAYFLNNDMEKAKAMYWKSIGSVVVNNVDDESFREIIRQFNLTDDYKGDLMLASGFKPVTPCSGLLLTIKTYLNHVSL
jgi:hypothetical protein